MLGEWIRNSFTWRDRNHRSTVLARDKMPGKFLQQGGEILAGFLDHNWFLFQNSWGWACLQNNLGLFFCIGLYIVDSNIIDIYLHKIN